MKTTLSKNNLEESSTKLDTIKKYMQIIKNEIDNLNIIPTIVKIEKIELDMKSIDQPDTNIEIKPIQLDLNTDEYLDKSILETDRAYNMTLKK